MQPGSSELEDQHEMGIALSGGGFRATLFHLGALWRLNEMYLLPQIARFSSVSGGSILAGLLAVRWAKLNFHDGIAVNFGDQIVNPIWEFCSRNIDVAAVAFGIVSGTWKLEQSYRKHLTGLSELQNLPDYPEFIFNTAHIETGRNCTLSKMGLHTWRLGDIELPNLPAGKGHSSVVSLPTCFPCCDTRLRRQRIY